MNHISDEAVAARESHRQQGKFGNQPDKPAAGNLADEPGDPRDDTGLFGLAYLDQFAEPSQRDVPSTYEVSISIATDVDNPQEAVAELVNLLRSDGLDLTYEVRDINTGRTFHVDLGGGFTEPTGPEAPAVSKQEVGP